MNYDDMTNEQINAKVHEHTGRGFCMPALMPDYCGDWGEMGPVIQEHKIDITYHESLCLAEIWGIVDGNDDVGLLSNAGNENPLRAAAICFLKMKESEK